MRGNCSGRTSKHARRQTSPYNISQSKGSNEIVRFKYQLLVVTTAILTRPRFRVDDIHGKHAANKQSAVKAQHLPQAIPRVTRHNVGIYTQLITMRSHYRVSMYYVLTVTILHTEKWGDASYSTRNMSIQYHTPTLKFESALLYTLPATPARMVAPIATGAMYDRSWRSQPEFKRSSIHKKVS